MDQYCRGRNGWEPNQIHSAIPPMPFPSCKCQVKEETVRKSMLQICLKRLIVKGWINKRKQGMQLIYYPVQKTN